MTTASISESVPLMDVAVETLKKCGLPTEQAEAIVKANTARYTDPPSIFELIEPFSMPRDTLIGNESSRPMITTRLFGPRHMVDIDGVMWSFTGLEDDIYVSKNGMDFTTDELWIKSTLGSAINIVSFRAKGKKAPLINALFPKSTTYNVFLLRLENTERLFGASDEFSTEMRNRLKRYFEPLSEQAAK